MREERTKRKRGILALLERARALAKPGGEDQTSEGVLLLGFSEGECFYDMGAFRKERVMQYLRWGTIDSACAIWPIPLTVLFSNPPGVAAPTCH